MDILSDKKLQVAMWLGTPAQARDPATKGALATMLEITPQTLSRWVKEEEVNEFARTYKSNYILYKIQPHLNRITDIAIEKAKTGGAADRRLLYELAGILGKQKGDDKDKPIATIYARITSETSKS
jgi:hypothetical protein